MQRITILGATGSVGASVFGAAPTGFGGVPVTTTSVPFAASGGF